MRGENGAPCDGGAASLHGPAGVLFATGDVLSRKTRSFIERAGGRLLEKPFGIDDVRNTVHSFFEEAP